MAAVQRVRETPPSHERRSEASPARTGFAEPEIRRMLKGRKRTDLRPQLGTGQIWLGQQNLWPLVMSFVAVTALMAGVIYLSGYARLASAGYKRAELKREIVRQRDIRHSLGQALAHASTPQQVEARARVIGMVRPDEMAAISIP